MSVFAWVRSNFVTTKSYLFEVRSDLIKSAKRYLFRIEVMAFQAIRKPFKILVIDRCQPLAPFYEFIA